MLRKFEKKPKHAKVKVLPSAHKLLLQSIKFYRNHWRTLLPVLALAATINWLLRLPGDASAALYQVVWFLFTTSAIIWTIRHSRSAHTKIKLGQAYFTGTAPALKLFLVFSALSLASIPFSIGLFLYSAVGVVSGEAASIGEQAIGIGLWVAFGMVSLYLIARLMFAPLIASLPDMGPTRSLSISWKLSRGNALSLSTKLVVALIYSLLLILVALLVMSFVGLGSGISQLLIEIIIGVLIVPLLLIYLFETYQYLK
jgi:hypothetical protein